MFPVFALYNVEFLKLSENLQLVPGKQADPLLDQVCLLGGSGIIGFCSFFKLRSSYFYYCCWDVKLFYYYSVNIFMTSSRTLITSSDFFERGCLIYKNKNKKKKLAVDHVAMKIGVSA